MTQPATIELAGTAVVLLPERALYWPEEEALFVADVHLGKPETFQRYGIAIPSEAASEDLARLDGLLTAWRPRALWFLGDLTHDRDAASPEVVAHFAALRCAHPEVQMHLVRGNHDRHIGLMPEAWDLEEHAEETRLGPFELRHHPRNEPGDHYALSGHLHPEVLVGGGGDALRLRCFVVGEDECVLPAFAGFAGGTLQVPAGQRWAIADDVVLPV